MENWKVIKEYPRYSVSDNGRVKNNISGKIISQRQATNGYMRVNVRTGTEKYEKPITLSVHRLVAKYFLPKVDGKEYVTILIATKLITMLLIWNGVPQKKIAYTHTTQNLYIGISATVIL